MTLRVMVTGDRFANGSDYSPITRVLDQILVEQGIREIIHGAAQGIDALADRWARTNNIAITPYPADWYAHDKAAGPIRNQTMVNTKPDLVLAFHGGKGTADAVKKAKAAGIPVREFRREWVEFTA